MAAHRYWRLNVTRGYTKYLPNNVLTAEIALRESIGGAQAAVGGTASASDSDYGAASNAFDGVTNNSNSTWGATPLPAWIRYDFGAGNAKDIVEVGISPSGNGSPAIADFQLQHSDDNAIWTTQFFIEDYSGWTAQSQIKSYSASTPQVGTRRRYRVRYLPPYGSLFTSTNTLVLRATVGGENIATGGVAIASSQGDYTTPPSALFDGSTSTFWYTEVSDGNWAPAYYGYEFAAATDVAQILITPHQSANRAPINFAWEVWDGTVWQTLSTFTDLTTGWTVNVPRAFTVAIAPDEFLTGSQRPSVFTAT